MIPSHRVDQGSVCATMGMLGCAVWLCKTVNTRLPISDSALCAAQESCVVASNDYVILAGASSAAAERRLCSTRAGVLSLESIM